MRLILLLAVALASLAGLPAVEARADAQLHVTARVVNRCTVELPDRPPWNRPGKGWRKWLEHRCDHPVHPHTAIARMADRDRAEIARTIGRGRVAWGDDVNHWVITITY